MTATAATPSFAPPAAWPLPQPGVSPYERFLSRVDVKNRRDGKASARCPAHQDGTASLSLEEGTDGRVLLHCFAGCETKDVTAAAGLTLADLFPPKTATTVKEAPRAARITLAQLAAHKGHDASFLKSLGLRDLPGGGVAIPYRDATGAEIHVKARTALIAKEGSYWPKNTPLMVYGLDRLGASAGDGLHIVEGETDAWALWAHGLNAIGVPGATNAALLTAEHLKPVIKGGTVYVHADNDSGAGEKFAHDVAVRMVALGMPPERIIGLRGPEGCKDAADLHRETPETGAFTAGIFARQFSPIHSAGYKTEVPAESILTFRTAREIAETTPEAVEWEVEPYVARGCIAEIDGKIKQGGKTTFLTFACRAKLDGLPFLGMATSAGPVVYLTEQPTRSFREALRRAGLLERDDFHVLAWHDARGVDWPGIVAAARRKCREVGASLLCVDTLPQWAGMKGDSENNSGHALEAVEPLQEAAALDNLAVVFVRHDRKAGGDVGDSGRGSSAFGGAVDIILSIRKPEGNARPTLRAIHALSRFDETPPTQLVELTDDGYVSHGSEEQVATAEARKAMLDALPQSEDAALTFDALHAELTDVKRTTAQHTLTGLVATGLAQKCGEGKKNKPFKYWQLGSAGTPVVPAETIAAARSNGRDNGVMWPAGIHSAGTTHLYTAESISAPEEGEL